MPDIKKTLFLFLPFLLLISFSVRSQGVKSLDYSPNSRVTLEGRITAIAIRSDIDLGNEVHCTLAGEAVAIPLDPDAPDYTYFISLATPVEGGTMRLETDHGIEVFLINSGQSPQINRARYRAHQGDCIFEFSAIPQSEWRAGLEPPSYTRSFTNVTHVVVHHSAGSNTATDYTQVVRDIYLYHTNTNGWSDIGYNYLVAQDGSTYTGRDPDTGEQDNVLGAHFCGSNSTTMGVCLLGNYQTAVATPETLSSLEEILAFKLDKEELDPFGEYPHAFGQLGSIIGHRDGCSTQCPGENVYQQLNDLRASTAQTLINCGQNLVLDFTLSRIQISAGESITFSNASIGYDEYQWLFEGGSPRLTDWANGGTVTYTAPGIFGVRLVGFTTTHSDTLYRERIIAVSGQPRVYPNPINSMAKFTIASFHEIEQVKVVDFSGRTQTLNALPDGKYQMPYLRQGVYFISIQTTRETVTKKILVR